MDVGVHEAKAHFSSLLRRVAAGEEVVIRCGGSVVAKLIPAGEPEARVFGTDEGVFTVPDDFDAPLPDQAAEPFEAERC